MQWIGQAGVFGLIGIGKVYRPCAFIKVYIFNQGAELLRAEYLRFLFGRKIDAFGIAAAFEVKNGVVAPAVFVVADKMAVRVGRKCSFPGTRQAEKYSCIAFWSRIG